MNTQNPEGVVIGTREIYDKVVEMQTAVNLLVTQVAAIPDHEARIRRLERWRYALPGTLVLSLVSIAAIVIEVAHAGT